MQQTFLVKYIYKNNDFDFFRHTQKKLSTILKIEKKYLNSTFCDIDKNDTETRLVVYATDYETTDDKIVYNKTIKDFFAENITTL